MGDGMSLSQYSDFIGTGNEGRPITKEYLLTEVIPLLLGDRMTISDEDLDRLLDQEEELNRELYQLWRSFPRALKEVKRYRTRKAELSTTDTKMLQARLRHISDARSRAIAEDTNDELDDSFFGLPPLDSDEHIIPEILRERGIDPYPRT